MAATHTLLKHVVPSLEAASGRQYKFTIVSPVSKFFHKVSAPRTLINPHLQGLDVGLVDIAPGLEQYGDKCVFLTGAVTTVDPSTKTVSYEGTEGAASGSARYDSLILASGADAREASYWSVTHGAKQLRAEFHELQSRIETAKTILIAGGGPVGVETAGEITNRFPARAKDVTIVSGGSRLLASIDNVAFGRHTERKLKRVGVEVLHNVRVSDSTRNAENGTTTVRLANGETRVVDLYIPCTGMRANSDFLPGSWVNGDGQASCDPQTFRVAGEKNVYAFGSIASYSDGTVFDVKNATKALAEAFRADQSEGVKGTFPRLAPFLLLVLIHFLRSYRRPESSVL